MYLAEYLTRGNRNETCDIAMKLPWLANCLRKNKVDDGRWDIEEN
jgi:hypothetical protein